MPDSSACGARPVATQRRPRRGVRDEKPGFVARTTTERHLRGSQADATSVAPRALVSLLGLSAAASRESFARASGCVSFTALPDAPAPRPTYKSLAALDSLHPRAPLPGPIAYACSLLLRCRLSRSQAQVLPPSA